MKSNLSRRRLTVDLSADAETATRSMVDRFFRGVTADAVRSALSLLEWTLRARRSGKRVVAVAPEELPDRFEEPVLPGVEEQLANDWTWLVQRPHPWRRQLFVKGRRLAAGDLARTIEIEAWSPHEAAEQFELPLDAILELQRYLAANRELVLAEERENAIAAERATTIPA